MLGAREQGDTLIEVILAVAVFAMVTVSSFAIMQRGTATAYDALERSVVRQRISGQAELLHYFRDRFVATKIAGDTVEPGSPAETWATITSAGYGTNSAPQLDDCNPDASSFYLDYVGATYGLGDSAIVAASGLPFAGTGIWIQRVDPPGVPAKQFYDFYIVSCWPSTTSQTQHMSSVVRLYDPQ